MALINGILCKGLQGDKMDDPGITHKKTGRNISYPARFSHQRLHYPFNFLLNPAKPIRPNTIKMMEDGSGTVEIPDQGIQV